ncbi:flagellar basal body-associated FliL family protein [Minwuia thermotolerans]|uniref:Flagellar protein FliL n=1 Tax=Minwuia thermotolerans TaxID=2056226 RepID=A0A2M9FXS0_9PROT|nr:flagellar basal body-associated FliL family protein [Minwuia thermotolerans]PJK28250.1 flagellar basal body protein FliL [Minwuia thermotolerans]
MADEEGEVPEDGDAPRKRKLSGKVLVLFIALPVLLLVGGSAAFMMLSGGDSPAEAAAESHAPVEDGHGKEESGSDHGGGESDGHGGADGHGGGVPSGGRVTYAGSDLIFYELPDMLVNLNTSGSQPRYLKIKVALEFGDGSIVKRIDRVMPRIVDHFQVYLRELRREDLRGSAGMYRLKEELMIRVNQSVRPARIRDVLFKEMLVQ